MNRQEEYAFLLKELEETVPDMDACLARAKRRKQRKLLLLRPLGGVAAAFAIFVLLVNYCAPVANACSRVPVLRELAEAVTFSRSLSDAVENDYVQEMNLSQTIDGITAEIPYLIVDQKQVNVFYRLTSEDGAELSADPDIVTEEGGYTLSSSWYAGDSGLQHITIDYVEGDVPERLTLRLRVQETGGGTAEEQAPERAMEDALTDTEEPSQPAYLVTFDFLLEFDPEFTAKGKIIPVEQEIELDGQKIMVKTVEVYPTHLRLEVQDDPQNSAWLKDLVFYIEAENGMTFTSDISGITATGSPEEDNHSMVSYRAESSFFYDAEHLSIVITGAEWLDKSRERMWVNLTTGESDLLPEGVAFEKAEKQGSGWYVSFRVEYREEEPMQQVFAFSAYDSGGNCYEINSCSTSYGEPDENGNYTYYTNRFPLKDYPYDEVWLEPTYTHIWDAAEPVVIEVQ